MRLPAIGLISTAHHCAFKSRVPSAHGQPVVRVEGPSHAGVSGPMKHLQPSYSCIPRSYINQLHAQCSTIQCTPNFDQPAKGARGSHQEDLAIERAGFGDVYLTL